MYIPSCGGCKKAIDISQKYVCGNEKCKKIIKCSVWFLHYFFYLFINKNFLAIFLLKD